MKQTKLCEIDECSSEYYGRGYCEKHYRRVYRKGSAEDPEYPRGLPLLDMLLARLPVREEGECWVWAGTFDTLEKYGSMKWQGKRQAAHRLMFYATHGYMPVETRHTCDNPPCCNPAHLLDGNRQLNVRDRVERGRSARRPGRANPNARYTDGQVDTVRKLWGLGGRTGDQIAALTGVNRNAVYRIKNGQK
jgi:hypothetical protein